MDESARHVGAMHPADVAVVSGHLAALAARISGPYQADVITGGGCHIPYLRVISQLEPQLRENVLCDFSTDPPGYLTAFGHRLGHAGDPAAAGLMLTRLLHAPPAGNGSSPG